MMQSSNKSKEGSNGPGEYLSVLEEKLHGVNAVEYKKEYLEKLSTYEQSIKGKMEKGDLTPEEYAVAQKVLEGLKGAEAIINFKG